MTINNLTLDEIERQLYISGSPDHALFVKMQDDIEDDLEQDTEIRLEDAYDNGYHDGYLASEAELE